MALGKPKSGKKRPNVIIRKTEVIEASHHGGAWKVAYADFVTAMMAFFLLMWLLNATTEDQRKGLADYFSPNNLLSHASSGTGQPFGGHTAFDKGALVSDRGAVQITVGKQPVPANVETGDTDSTTEAHGLQAGNAAERGLETGNAAEPGLQAGNAAERGLKAGNAAERGLETGNAAFRGLETSSAAERGRHESAPPAAATLIGPSMKPAEAAKSQMEKAAFEEAAQQIRDAVKDDPALAELARQLVIDMTPDGLRIQIVDEVRQPMFATGSADPNDRARLLLHKVAPVLARLPEAISIAGHTDSAPFPGPGRTNWELSAERANATRRLLVDGGLPETRFRSVTGNADKDPLLPDDPLAAANRRIAILVLRAATASRH